MTPSSEAIAPRAPTAGLYAWLGRERALLALFDLGRRKGLGLRAAKVYAFGVFVTYAVAISVTHGSDRRAVIQGCVHAALVSLSWVVGALAALGTARIAALHTDRDALRALALQRGFSASAVLRARLLASAGRVVRLIAVPALLLVGIAVARGQGLAWAWVTAPAVVAYAAALGLTLALLAHVAAALSPRHARALLAALVLGPWLISEAFPAVPSLPSVFRALLERALDAGAAFTWRS